MKTRIALTLFAFAMIAVIGIAQVPIDPARFGSHVSGPSTPQYQGTVTRAVNEHKAKNGDPVSVPAPWERNQPQSDPRFAGVNSLQNMLASKEHEIEKSIQTMTQAIQGMQTLPNRSAIRAYARGLEAHNVTAIMTTHSLQNSVRVLLRELKHAEQAYLAASNGFLARGEDITDPVLKETTLKYARKFQDLARGVPGEVSKLEAFQVHVNAFMPDLIEAQKGITDFGLFVDTYPVQFPSADLDAHLGAMANFARRFDAFHAAVQQYQKSR